MNHSISAQNVKENRYGTFPANLILIMVLFSLFCSPRVLIPPRIDLKPYATLGMIQLESNAKGTLADYTSQKLLRSVLEAQPGTPVIELGTMSHVLGSIGCSELDIEAIKLLGAKYGIGAVVIGRLTVEKVKPSVSIGSLIKQMTVSAFVEAKLNARLVETQAGATVWSNSSQGREDVASVSLAKGDTRFDARDPEKAYGSLVNELVGVVTDDFRSHWK
ncbi:MAG: hypothetical protein JW768_01170 [Chitinispirillaceae bacterium]|nr:hypothetical protein [Chitinispirillaceae bacterium]